MNTPRVSREQAEWLKKVGYDVPTWKYYDADGLLVTLYRDAPYNFNGETIVRNFSAPTLHEAADWLRSKGVHVYTEPVWDGLKGWIGVVVLLATFRRIDTEKFDTHDLAYEAGIVHGLKYIK